MAERRRATARGPVGLALAEGRDRLAAAGCESPRLDAELLLGAVLGVERARLIMDRHDQLSGPAWAAFQGLLARREAREPVAYILGRRAFRRLDLVVDGRVLIPRPETELLVEIALGLPTGARVADVGTGSGAIALALADERPDLAVIGLDISEHALQVARANAARLGLEVSFRCADLLDEGSYDAVLANLPYVPEETELAPEIADYEPAEALCAGPDGLDVVRRLVTRIAGRAVRPAMLGLEISPEQAPATEALIRGAGYATVQTHADLAGHARVVVGAA
ncbi:MAG: peptide chain release factor N(5)-glutamine methyltransferase [Actinomycetota bacterium]|nr:peptide chain release factor N(5)-glutamine methyltransferase [Actinomycetota bacterium]